CVIRVGLVIVIGTLLGLLKMCLKGIFGCALEIHVDRGVNAIAFVYCTVPSHGCDHLLTNVIYGVSLALSGLPAANRDLFSARSSTLFMSDESVVAHSIECKIPRLT